MGIFNKHTKQDVKSKTTLTDTKGRKLGTEIEFKDGSKTTLLNPNGKGRKYAREIKDNVHLLNDMNTVKRDDKGNSRRLTDIQKSYRSGYLKALQDQAKIHNSKKNGGE